MHGQVAGFWPEVHFVFAILSKILKKCLQAFRENHFVIIIVCCQQVYFENNTES